jgi:hypothetical protein
MRKRLLHSLVFERTEFDLSKIIWLCGIIQFHSNSVGVLEQVFIASHSYQIFFQLSKIKSQSWLLAA